MPATARTHYHRRFSKPPSSLICTSGFTLIELLTVIAIIGILAAIIIPVVGKVRQTAQSAVCRSNMRQIGAALIMYAQDNKDFLPIRQIGTDPFLHVGQGPSYSTDHRRIQNQIYTYFGYAAPTKAENTSDVSKMHWDPIFACPSWKSARNQSTQNIISSIRLTKRVTLISTGATFTSDKGPWIAGKKLSDVFMPTLTWALMDIDSVNFSSEINNIPAKPVHGKYRNTLYFDGHVGTTDSSLGPNGVDDLNKKIK